MVALYLQSSIRLIGVVLNYAQGLAYLTDVGYPVGTCWDGRCALCGVKVKKKVKLSL
jgi:hypothetical protein